MAPSLADLLDDLHKRTIETLLTKIESGTATAADLNVARALLKDNNITSVPKDANAPLNNLAQSLPFSGDEDDVAYPH
jgi:hypothetical protein